MVLIASRGGRAFVSGGRGGFDTALWRDPAAKGSIDGAPKTLTPNETDPRAPEVTRTQNSAKNGNGSSRGF